MKRFYIVILTVLVTVFLCLPANAAVCSEREKFKRFLNTKYSEYRVAIGTVRNQSVMEFYISKSGSWTLTVTSPRGLTCLVAAGTDYEAVKPVEGSPL